MNISLEGKTALICGSTQGIGLATAQLMAEQGAHCILLARNEEKLQTAVNSLSGNGHAYLVADFAQPTGLREVLKKELNEPVHILVNNTGGPAGGPIIDADPDQFLSAFQQHLICNHLLVQHLWKGMEAEAYGRIINVISTSVKQPLPGLGVSNTIRGAVANWSKTLCSERNEISDATRSYMGSNGE